LKAISEVIEKIGVLAIRMIVNLIAEASDSTKPLFFLLELVTLVVEFLGFMYYLTFASDHRAMLRK